MNSKKSSTQSVTTIGRFQAMFWALKQLTGTSPALVIVILGCTLVQGSVPAAFAVSLRGLINAVAESPPATPGLLDNPLFWLVAAFLITALDSFVGQWLQYVTARLRSEMSLSFNRKLMEHAASVDLPYFENPENREVLERVSADPGARIHSLFMQLQSTVLATFQVITLVGILIWLEPFILLFALLLTVPFFLFNWKLARMRYQIAASRSKKKRRTRYFLSLLTLPRQVGEIKILGISGLLLKRFTEIISEFRDVDKKLYLKQFIGGVSFMTPIIAVFFFLFGRVVYRVVEGELSVGDLAMFGGAVVRLRQSVDSAVRAAANTYELTLHINDLKSFLSSEPIVVDEPRTEELPTLGRIEVENLWFTYPSADTPTLKNINFVIESGQTVAVVGQNGSGKSTLAKLLARLYDPDSGEIRIDGTPIRDFPIQALHSRIALMAQDFGRLEDSIANNIAYADWDRLKDDRQEIERIARETGLDIMASKFPDGLDTRLGRIFYEHDVSGGQWQLLASARMLARQAAIYILDEPTSNIDAIAEHRLVESFSRLAAEQTKIVVSHRFSTISMADVIMVMDNGELVEYGTHSDLLALGGLYSRLFEMHEQYRMEL